ncbi:MAG TPA: acyl carrier protein [Vicinamibacterales bacterium]|nr:acyl carrier protein [Vicinamibacterales bacterium]
MNDTRARLVRAFGAVFPGLDEREIPQATPETVDSWDSLASATLLSVLEEEFGLDIPPEDTDRLASFADVLAYVERRAARGEAAS